jgi:hypothetical protein
MRLADSAPQAGQGGSKPEPSGRKEQLSPHRKKKESETNTAMAAAFAKLRG